MRASVQVIAGGLHKRMRSVRAHAKNMRPAFSIIGREAIKSAHKNFDAEGRPQKWALLTEQTLDSKIRIKSGEYKGEYYDTAKANKILDENKILTDTGDLRNSITREATAHYVDVGPGMLPYARIHQFGFNGYIKRKWKNGKSYRMKMKMPARPYMVVQDEDSKKYARILIDFILEGKK